MIMEKGKIQVGTRGLQLLAKQAVDSLEKGLIELLTNGDESYHRLEKKGQIHASALNTRQTTNHRCEFTLTVKRELFGLTGC